MTVPEDRTHRSPTATDVPVRVPHRPKGLGVESPLDPARRSGRPGGDPADPADVKGSMTEQQVIDAFPTITAGQILTQFSAPVDTPTSTQLKRLGRGQRRHGHPSPAHLARKAKPRPRKPSGSCGFRSRKPKAGGYAGQVLGLFTRCISPKAEMPSARTAVDTSCGAELSTMNAASTLTAAAAAQGVQPTSMLSPVPG